MSALAGEREILTVERVVAGGQGLARRANGQIAFVDGSLPGEIVDALVATSRGGRATVVDVRRHDATRSAIRTEPPCPALHAGCGGCDWQHVSASAQLEVKTSIVVDALRRTGKIADAAERTSAAGSVPSWGYRTSARMVADRAGRLGFRARRSHEVVVGDSCAVMHPDLFTLAQGVRATPGADVSLRIGDGDASVMVHDGDLLSAPNGVGRGASARTTQRITPKRHPAFTLTAQAASFFQSGPAAAALLIDVVGDAVGALDDHTVVDAYGGCGLFTVGLRLDAATIIESSPSACADAELNVAAAGLAATIVQQQVERMPDGRADVVIADPARAGLGKQAVATLARTGARRIVLVSCDPVAGARDAALLSQAGYSLVHANVLDLFPQTSHVEVVARFERGDVPGTTNDECHIAESDIG